MSNQKRDCFAFTEFGCRALNEKNCDRCAFYKARKQYEAEKKKVNKRLRALGYPIINDDISRVEHMKKENAERMRRRYAEKKGLKV